MLSGSPHVPPPQSFSSLPFSPIIISPQVQFSEFSGRGDLVLVGVSEYFFLISSPTSLKLCVTLPGLRPIWKLQNIEVALRICVFCSPSGATYIALCPRNRVILEFLTYFHQVVIFSFIVGVCTCAYVYMCSCV